MSNASHTDTPEFDSGIENDDNHANTDSVFLRRIEALVNERPIEFTIRLFAGLIGLLLVVVTVQHVTRPPLADNLVRLLQSSAGQWLAVGVLAVLLLVGALRGNVV